MDNARLTIRRPDALTLSRQDVQTLLSAGDGDAALLYLYILQNGGELELSRAAVELNRSDRDIQSAAASLQKMGILSAGAASAPVPLPTRELPEYQAGDLIARSAESPEFRALAEETEAVLGRVLTSTDLKKLFGIYDDLSLPADVIMLLIHHCKEEYETRYGPKKLLGFSAIEKEAYVWFHREIITYDQAEQWLARMEDRKSVLGALRHTLGIQNRALSATEEKYLNDWLDLGFSEEALALAADRTVTNTGELKWRYMNSIVQSWEKKGLHTVDEIESGDKKPGKPGKYEASLPARDDSRTLEQLDRLREKMRSGS